MDLRKFRSMRQKPGVLALAVKGTTAELLIYDIIGEDWFGDGVTAKSVVQQISALPDEVNTILVRVNSPGGDVFDGVAILNALLTFRGTVNVQIDGLCASIASVIIMAGKQITMAETATLMIHNPWTLAVGDSNDMRAMADLLDKLRSGSMLPAYARSGLTPERITAIMDAETWYTAAEAKEAGWIDAITEMPARPGAHARYNLAAFKHPPAAVVGADDCTCPCESCQAGDCTACTHVDCDCEGCEDCPQMAAKAAKTSEISAEMKQKALIRAQKRAENLRLASIS